MSGSSWNTPVDYDPGNYVPIPWWGYCLACGNWAALGAVFATNDLSLRAGGLVVLASWLVSLMVLAGVWKVSKGVWRGYEYGSFTAVAVGFVLGMACRLMI